MTSPTAQRRSPARNRESTRIPCSVGRDADRLQTKPGHARSPPGGDEQAVAAQLGAPPPPRRRPPPPRRRRRPASSRPGRPGGRGAGATGRTTCSEFDARPELRGDRLLVATGRRPRVDGLGLETVGVEADGHGIPVDSRLRAGERLWAIGDITGIWPLTHVGKYQGEVVAANILGEPREAHYEVVPRVVYTDPQAAAVVRRRRGSAAPPRFRVAKT